MNYRMSHVKGHQFNLRGKESVISGDFVSRFLDALDSLQDELATKLPHFLRDSISTTELGSTLWQYAKTSGAERIFSNRTCLACLSRMPVHALPCGHCICDPCSSTLNANRRYQEMKLVIPRCPLGCEWPGVREWTISRKPLSAGVRVLSLDGYVLHNILPNDRQVTHQKVIGAVYAGLFNLRFCIQSPLSLVMTYQSKNCLM
jgi:hypothetical protein